MGVVSGLWGTGGSWASGKGAGGARGGTPQTPPRPPVLTPRPLWPLCRGSSLGPRSAEEGQKSEYREGRGRAIWAPPPAPCMALWVCEAWALVWTHRTASLTAVASAPGTGWRSPGSLSPQRPCSLPRGHLGLGRAESVYGLPALHPCTSVPLPHLAAGSGPGLRHLCTAAAPASRSHPWGGGGGGTA